MQQNKFHYENISRVSTHAFIRIDHPTLTFRTRAVASYTDYELMKSSDGPQPILSVKYVDDGMEDQINKRPETIRHEQTLNARTKLRLKSALRAKKILNEENMINEDVLDVLKSRLHGNRFSYFFEPNLIDLNFHRGTLDLVEGDLFNSLVHVQNGLNIHFTRLQENEFKKLHSKATAKTPIPNELILKPNSDFIVVRYKDYIDIAKAPEDYESLPKALVLRPNEQYEEDSKDFIACSLQNKYLTTVNVSHKLSRYDLDLEYYPMSLDLSKHFGDRPLTPISLQDNVESRNRHNNITLTTRHNFTLIDCRAKKHFVMDKIVTNENHLMTRCEKIMNHAQSKLDKNLVFISTSHFLYAFDYRNLKEPVVHWTHHLVKPALMLKTALYGTDEFVCLSSHKQGDLVLFNHAEGRINYHGFKPTSVCTTYNDLREQGQFLLSDSEDVGNIKKRVYASTTGIALRPDPLHRQLKLYTQNYFGDIFEHVITCRNKLFMHETERNLSERYHMWESHLRVPRNPNEFADLPTKRLRTGTMVIADIARLRGLSKVLTGEEIPRIDIADVEPEHNSVTQNQSWRINIQDAREYKDFLATEIMQVWDDIEMEEARPAVFAEALDMSKVEQEQGVDKVSLWLAKTSDQPDITMEYNDDSRIFAGEVSQAATSSFIAAPKVTNTSTPRTARKKPRVAGF